MSVLQIFILGVIGAFLMGMGAVAFFNQLDGWHGATKVGGVILGLAIGMIVRAVKN